MRQVHVLVGAFLWLEQVTCEGIMQITCSCAFLDKHARSQCGHSSFLHVSPRPDKCESSSATTATNGVYRLSKPSPHSAHSSSAALNL